MVLDILRGPASEYCNGTFLTCPDRSHDPWGDTPRGTLDTRRDAISEASTRENAVAVRFSHLIPRSSEVKTNAAAAIALMR